ncbi:MAG TPA: sulfur carrier protein ThiS [Candidatus Krumholzibacteria bacterium]|jgi:thiamine biosynthesis protein ThiS
MEILVNGKATKLPTGLRLDELVRRLELNERHLVVEHNGTPLRFDDARSLELRDGDRLELVRPVAGG